MAKYNPKTLEDFKYEILGIYIGHLQELQTGFIPICFEKTADLLSKVLIFFPDEEKQEYVAVWKAGLDQVKFLEASKIVNALSREESSRKKTIDDFLIKKTE